MLLFGMGNIGTGGTAPVVTSPTPQPVAVSNIAVASTTSSTIALTFTSPSTGVVTWNYRAHGATVWMPAPSGSNFGTSSGTFVSLASGSAYDFQAVTTLNGVTAAGELDNVSTAAASVAIQPTAPTGLANRYDVVFDQSVVAPGGTVTGRVLPNAGLAGGNVVLTPSAGNAITISLPSSGSAAVPFSFTAPLIGDDYFTPSNTAGLYNPWPPQINVFAGSSGTSRTLAASLVATAADMRTYQRDTASGTPTGFPSSFNRGWGPVAIAISSLSGATDGVWIRLYDALSAGASATVGTGTALHSSPVQVHGALGATGTINPHLPASASIYYADIATDAAFTNPVRIAQRFRVGVVLGLDARSFECGMAREYNDGGTTFPAIYTKAATWVSQDHRYGAGGANWFLQDNVGTNTYAYEQGEHSSSAVEEFGRLIESQLGVCVGITGSAEAGGDFDGMVAHDGTLAGGFTGTVPASCDNKFRYFWGATSGWSGENSAYPTETHAENRTRYFAAVDFIARTYPACAVIGWVTGASGVFGSDGSRATGYTRNQMVFLNEIEPVNPMVVSKESYLWNEFVGNHASMGARIDYARPGFRKLMAAELAAMGGFQTSARGPVLASTGTYSASARTITIGYTIAAGATLKAIAAAYSNPSVTYGAATAQEICKLFAVYGAGGYNGNGTAITISNATFDANAKTITLTLAGSSGVTYADSTTGPVPSGLTLHYAADFGASGGSGRAAILADDRTGNGIPYGWHMLPALDIPISVAA